MAPKYEQRAKARIRSCLQRFGPIIERAETEGFNESDTADIVQDILHEGLGYQKFFEITSEFQIKRHYADVALKIDGKVKIFVEVKSIGSRLRERDVFQIQSYSASHNLPWMLLTDGRTWICYHLSSGTPPAIDEVFHLDLLEAGNDPASVVDCLYLLSKEAVKRNLISEYWEVARATSPEMVGSCLLSDRVIQGIRREVRRRTGQRIKAARIYDVLRTQVMKGSLVEAIAKRPSKPSGRSSKGSQGETKRSRNDSGSIRTLDGKNDEGQKERPPTAVNEE